MCGDVVYTQMMPPCRRDVGALLLAAVLTIDCWAGPQDGGAHCFRCLCCFLLVEFECSSVPPCAVRRRPTPSKARLCCQQPALIDRQDRSMECLALSSYRWGLLP